MAGLALLLLCPLLHLFLVLANLLVHFVILGFQFIAVRLPRTQSAESVWEGQEPFISILVPAHNEPPEVLRETLTALSRLRWANYEVLVIDNNTTNENLWRPVEELCRELGAPFRFFHVENLPGAKAGALNHARRWMNPQAEFIFVVDADYVVERNVLRRALRHVADAHTGLVQFPQEYRNVEPGNTGIALDFHHFFAGYMNMANYLGCVPATGTLTLIRVEALDAVGGFCTRVITEDAELGFRLHLAGWRSVYAHEIVGRGLMPHDLTSLKKQRWRWAFGNAQILKQHWPRLLCSRELDGRQKLGHLIHLTAWFNFNLIPSLSLIVLTPAAWLGHMHPLQPYIVVFSGFTLVTFLVLRFGTMFYSLRRDGCCRREVWLAFFTHLGLDWIFSASWLKCLFADREPFVRTNKFLTQKIPSLWQATVVELSLGVALLIAGIVLAMGGFILGPVAAFLTVITRSLIYWVWWQTRRTWETTWQHGSNAVDALLSRHFLQMPPGCMGIGSETFKK